ncbi:MAG: transglutaminase domain-containing protein [Myxococcota bacterium]|nr:transglutaminase domain-containing protein [Myxococcota bacterium]
MALLLLGSKTGFANEVENQGADSRTFEFFYESTIGPIEAGQGPVEVFIPLPRADRYQRVLSLDVDANIPGQIEEEAKYGNRYWRGSLAESTGAPIEVAVRAAVTRSLSDLSKGETPSGGPREFDPELFLSANRRVVVDHPILDPIREEVRAAAPNSDKATLARAIYDWVVDNVEYKKVGKGWGNGDTFWACNERYGNCTDFHSLYISLARSEGIPARFEMGFPIPEDRASGEIGGYHCWVEFYLPGEGWTAIDASEASKAPEKREAFYGRRAGDRIYLTTGRDLRLGEHHQGRPLNYFIYPYVEVAGKEYAGPVRRSVRFDENQRQAAVPNSRKQ